MPSALGGFPGAANSSDPPTKGYAHRPPNIARVVIQLTVSSNSCVHEEFLTAKNSCYTMYVTEWHLCSVKAKVFLKIACLCEFFATMCNRLLNSVNAKVSFNNTWLFECHATECFNWNCAQRAKWPSNMPSNVDARNCSPPEDARCGPAGVELIAYVQWVHRCDQLREWHVDTALLHPSKFGWRSRGSDDELQLFGSICYESYNTHRNTYMWNVASNLHWSQKLLIRWLAANYTSKSTFCNQLN